MTKPDKNWTPYLDVAENVLALVLSLYLASLYLYMVFQALPDFFQDLK